MTTFTTTRQQFLQMSESEQIEFEIAVGRAVRAAGDLVIDLTGTVERAELDGETVNAQQRKAVADAEADEQQLHKYMIAVVEGGPRPANAFMDARLLD